MQKLNIDVMQSRFNRGLNQFRHRLDGSQSVYAHRKRVWAVQVEGIAAGESRFLVTVVRILCQQRTQIGP
jgi:hypothetical protein